MKYDKQPLTYEQQADRLIRRGLVADQRTLVERLKAVNYYRLSGYLYPFRAAENNFLPDTTLDKVWERYVFDRQLRLIVMDAIERIEVSIRTSLVYEMAHSSGPFGYLDKSNLQKLSSREFRRFHEKLQMATERSHETFVSHFKTKYGDEHRHLPIWMAAETMTFGMTLTLFRGVATPIRQKIAGSLGISEEVLTSWILSLNTIRNICAHHGRLWNRPLRISPKIPRKRKHGEWHESVKIDNHRLFVILTVCKYLLDKMAPQSSWTRRLIELLEDYPDIPRTDMGFPPSWENSPIWARGSERQDDVEL